jgi:hypothetical protein
MSALYGQGSQAIGQALLVPIGPNKLVISVASWAQTNKYCSSTSIQCTGAPDGKCSVSDNQGWSPFRVLRQKFYPDHPDTEYLEIVEAFSNSTSEEVPVPFDDMPVMFTFSGAPSIKSMRVVDTKHLEQTSGSDVQLQSLTVNITRDPVDHGITNILPFLKNVPRGSGCGPSDITDRVLREVQCQGGQPFLHPQIR